MAFEIVMPRLGWSMETGSLVEWLKEEGEFVEKGEILFTVEGEKAVQEIEALESGILRLTPDSPAPGEEVAVGTVLAYLLEPDEPAPFETDAPSQDEEAATVAEDHQVSPSASPTPEASPSKPPARDRSEPTISPRARRAANELGVNWKTLEGSGRTGRIIERDVRQAAQEREAEDEKAAVRVSPVARRLAEAKGVELTEIAAEKPGKRITREDVEEAIAGREAFPTPPTPMQVAGETVPVTRIRRVIAQRMADSSHTTAPLTLTTEADATELVAVHERLKAALEPRGKVVPSYNDLIIKLTGLALQEHAMLNAYWRDDEIFLAEDINVGMAVDTEAGLLVPVVRNVPQKSVQQIAEETRVLAEKARTRQLKAEQMEGGTFTVTNLGLYNIDAFTPIINLPECAILGVGRIVSRPAIWNGEVVPRQRVALSLTFDHRIVDGAPAARFLNTVLEYVEEPYSWLVV